VASKAPIEIPFSGRKNPGFTQQTGIQFKGNVGFHGEHE
jgi:hypothetical protein